MSEGCDATIGKWADRLVSDPLTSPGPIYALMVRAVPSLPPAAWYPDPEHPRTWRYWNGTTWTGHRAPMGAPASPAEPGSATRVGGVPAYAAAAAPPPRGRKRIAVIVGSATAGLLLVGAAWAAGATTSTTTVTSAVPTASSTTVPAAPQAAESAVTTPAAPSPRPADQDSASSAATSPPGVAGTTVDVAGVVDGDTIKVRLNGVTEKVRLIGIDTPELNPAQCYGQKAASAMQSMVQGKQVMIASDPTQADRDQYGRLLRHVYLTDGRSAALSLITDGFGKEYTFDKPYSGQANYVAAQSTAQSAGRGLWGAECAPAAAAPGPAPDQDSSTTPASDCKIKGNISSSGEKIYHMPGQRYYDETKIDLAKGEKWFCSPAQAEAAGWRAAKV